MLHLLSSVNRVGRFTICLRSMARKKRQPQVVKKAPRRSNRSRQSHEKSPQNDADTASPQEEDFLRRPAVKIFVPDALKSILVDDWEKVTKENKLAPVPSPTPVTQFLNEYETAESTKRQPGSPDADILEEVIAGVKEYFNKALGRVLLYRFERPQFYEWHKELEKGHGDHAGETFCDIYGCEHLLRLFGMYR